MGHKAMGTRLRMQGYGAQGYGHKATDARLWGTRLRMQGYGAQGYGRKAMGIRLRMQGYGAQGYGHKATDARLWGTRLWAQGYGHTIICVYSIVSFVSSNRRNVGEVVK